MAHQNFRHVQINQEFAGSVVKLRITIKKKETVFSFTFREEQVMCTIVDLGTFRSKACIDNMALFHGYGERSLKDFGKIVQDGERIFLRASKEQVCKSIVKIVSDIVKMVSEIYKKCPFCASHYASVLFYKSLNRDTTALDEDDKVAIKSPVQQCYADVIHNLACYCIWDNSCAFNMYSEYEPIQIDL